MEIRHLYESQQLTPRRLSALMTRADELKELSRKGPRNLPQTLDRYIMASLFYEPSTRTRFSHEAAMIRLGGEVIGTENAAQFSSAKKGESLADTVRVMGRQGGLLGYEDIVVVRHTEEGEIKKASEVSSIPIINAGDGPGQHPTQALLDVYTLQSEFGKIEGLNVAMVGDLKNGRTVKSLCYLLGKFNDINITFVSPDWLAMSPNIKAYLKRHEINYRETAEFEDVLQSHDAIYMTRIQREREQGISDEEFQRAEDMFAITKDNLPLVPSESRILHPLPHLHELQIPYEAEETDRRIAYFRQANNGLYARMALLEWSLMQGPFEK